MKSALLIYAALVDLDAKITPVLYHELLDYISRNTGEQINAANLSRVLRSMMDMGLVEISYVNEKGEVSKERRGFFSNGQVQIMPSEGHFLI